MFFFLFWNFNILPWQVETLCAVRAHSLTQLTNIYDTKNKIKSTISKLICYEPRGRRASFGHWSDIALQLHIVICVERENKKNTMLIFGYTIQVHRMHLQPIDKRRHSFFSHLLDNLAVRVRCFIVENYKYILNSFQNNLRQCHCNIQQYLFF